MATQAERILIIGAGMAGLTMARTLSDAGAQVTVAEKGRSIGGRMASRETEHGTFDHGAQYVTGKSGAFRALLTGLSHDGTVQFWKPTGRDRTIEWHVGVPAMNQMLTPMLGGFDLRQSTTATRIDRVDNGLSVEMRAHGDEGAREPEAFDRVLVTAPAPQTHALLKDHGEPFGSITDAYLAPCWTLMVAFEQRIDCTHEFHRAEPGDAGALAWVARNSSKPARAGEPDLWIANATPRWSEENLERDKKDVVAPLLDAFGGVVGDQTEPIHASAHRWRYSLVEKPLGEPFLLSDDGRLGAAGDWCIAGRVEAAFESGRQLADAVKQRL